MIAPISSDRLSPILVRPAAGALPPHSGRSPQQITGVVEPRPSATPDHVSGFEPGDYFVEIEQALTTEQRQQMQRLRQADQQVRQHEAAHQTAGGQHVQGSPSYQYKTGPDGKQYAVGGEVRIDTSSVAGDPETTIRKMQQIRRAALAPAQPSAQDRAVAAKAAQIEQRARAELRSQGSGSAAPGSIPPLGRNIPDSSHPAGVGHQLNLYA
ncbi:MAG TPA: putative metalloprotease CJM1_0395 family protein [Phycisphaerae bacterium]|nr:putative metalloprotease CJM1_0395 family protein [Phycisphaerae bacterium]